MKLNINDKEITKEDLKELKEIYDELDKLFGRGGQIPYMPTVPDPGQIRFGDPPPWNPCRTGDPIPPTFPTFAGSSN